MLWLPLPDSVTAVLQLPPLPTVAVPSAVVLPLSNSVTVLPASATSTVPLMVCAAWLVAPPLLVMATTGAVVSRVKLNAAVVELLPADIAELRRDRLGAVGAEVAGGYAQADAAGGDVRRGDGVGHRMRQRRTAQQQLHGVAGRHRRIERDGKTRRRHVGDAVGMRRAGIRRRRESRRAAARRRGVEGDGQCRGG